MEYRVKTRIIGGMFGLEKKLLTPSNSFPPFLKEQDILLANARSGISLLVDLLLPSQVWMPSYLCGSMLNSVNESLTKVRFYEVNFDLEVLSLQWLDNVKPNDLVIVIDYFGFPLETDWTAKAKKQGAWILEDASQALLSETMGQIADFVLYSPRKFLGVPDGGILTFNQDIEELNNICLEKSPVLWWLKAFFATILRREFDLHGGDRHWFELFQEVNASCPIGPYAMSELSEMLLRHSFDYRMIAQKRVENYKFLAESLAELALFKSLPSQVVPVGFPIRVKGRDRIRQVLFDHEIYPPVHWPIQNVVPGEFRDSHCLAAEIMTLPCDQRYDSTDMERMIQIVRKAL